jgi:hypothetical protein
VIKRSVGTVALGVLSIALGTRAAAAPTHLLTRTPYLGVACPVPDSIGCDRVGLAVWLTRPARSVSALIGGRRFALDDDHWSGPARHGLRRMLAGFLHPAGLTRGPLRVVPDGPGGRWADGHPVSARVELAIRYGDGTHARIRLRLRLHAGWG